MIHTPQQTNKILSTFQRHPPSTSSRPISTPTKLNQFHHDALRHHQHLLPRTDTIVQQQFSPNETSNRVHPRLPSVQSATLPHTFSSSKRGRKSRSSNRQACSKESNSGKQTTGQAGEDADSESDSIDSIYKRLSGPPTSPPNISECVRNMKNSFPPKSSMQNKTVEEYIYPHKKLH